MWSNRRRAPRARALAGIAVLAAALAVPPTPDPAWAATTTAPGGEQEPPATATGLVPLSGRGTPVLDGAWSAREWDRAGRHDFTVEIPAVEGGGLARATVLVMNDDANLYLASWLDAVVGCSFYPSFSFDSDGDGDPHDPGSDDVGGHVSAWSEGATELLDSFYAPGHTIAPDTWELEGYPPAGTIDGAAAGGHPGGTTTFAEFAHPLDSADDAHDISARVGDTIRMTWSAFLNGGGCGRCEGEGCTTGGAAPALGQFVVTFVPADDAPPAMVGVPGVGAVVPSVLGEGSTRIWWAGEDPGGTGVDVYDVDLARDAGPWKHVATTSATELSRPLRLGHRYRFRVTPRDLAGNWGIAAVGPSFTPDLVQDGAARVQYAGRWARRPAASAAGGSVTSTTRAGASVRVTFTGYSISWVTSTGPGRGRVQVLLDGVPTRTIDLDAASVHWRRVRCSATWMDGGQHTLELRTLDDGRRVDVDAFVLYR